MTSDWQGGLLQGRARIEKPDGTVYEGDVVAGLREGQGIYTTTDGMRHEGPGARARSTVPAR